MNQMIQIQLKMDIFESKEESYIDQLDFLHMLSQMLKNFEKSLSSVFMATKP